MNGSNEIKNFLFRHKTTFIPYQYTPPPLNITPSYFLTSQKEFSDSFLDYIGFRHITYYDDELGRVLLQFFHNYLDHYTNKLPSTLNKIKNLPNNSEIQNNFLLHKSWMTMGPYIAELWNYAETHNELTNRHTPAYDSLSTAIQEILNLNINDSCATLAHIQELDFKNFYSHIAIGDPSIINVDYPIEKFFPNSLSEFNLLFSKKLTNYNKKILSKIYSYQIDNKYIILSASIRDDSIFAFGHIPPYATFYNFTQIDKNPNDSILFFQNINQAFAYENILINNNIKLDNFIITGHNSDNLEMLDWSLLAHKKLIFICEPKKKAYEEINYYKYYFDNYAINFKIFPYPLLFSKLRFNCYKQPDFNNLSYTEQNLLKNALYIDKNPQKNLNTVCNNSLSWKNFIHLGNELGLFSKYQTEENFFAYSPLLDTDFEEFEDNIHNIPINSLFLNNSITLLHAPTETGKSIFALAIAKALLDSSQILFFKTSQVQPKILILDEETPSGVFSKRLKQLFINKNNNNLITISIIQEKNKSTHSLWSNIDLSKEKCRDQLTTFIKTNKINFMILDNLGYLVSQNLNTDKLPQDIFNCLYQITGKCSVLLIHHTKQDGLKVRGSQLWSNKTPNEIQLINVRNDQRSIKRYKNIINQYLPQKDQAFCGVRFNKTKSYPIFKIKYFG